MPDPTGADSVSGSASPTPGEWKPPGVDELQDLLPQYEIEEMIGLGGMGAVYRGRQASLRRKVAIKVLPETFMTASGEADSAPHQFVERFRLEARAMAALDHPAIVSVYDFGQTDAGHLYFVMEFIDGMDIQQYIKACGGSVPAEHAIAIVSHVLDALDYAHSEGIIHRDIKPANVLINQEGRVKIADFGLAKQHREGAELEAMTELTQAEVTLGTPDYIAPEAFEDGVTPDGRSDLYAVGVMLYRMLTGKLPRGRFELPSKHKPEFDERFDRVIAQALESDPEHRYQNAYEFRSKLGELLSEPVSRVEAGQKSGEVRPPVDPDELPQDDRGHWWRRRKTLVAAGAVGVLGLAAALLLAVRPKQPGAGETDGAVATAIGNGEPELSGAPGGTMIEPVAPPPEWPTGEHFQSLGRFRAWSSRPDDAVIDLRRLRAIDDPRQIHVRGGGWVVLRDNGETISSNDKTNREKIRRICPGRHDHFALISEDGELLAFNGKGDQIVGGDMPSDLGPVRDAYIAPFHRVALLEDGTLRVWGRAYDGINEKGNPEWKVKPALPAGRKAVAISSTDISLAVLLDDGRLLAWSMVHGSLEVPEAFAADKVEEFILNLDYLLAVPTGGGRAVSWHYRQPQKPAGHSPADAPVRALRDASLDTLLFGVDRQPRFGGNLATELPEIEAVLEPIECEDPNLISVHLARTGEDRSPFGRLLWFDSSTPPPSSRGAIDVETFEIDGESYFSWKGEHVEIQSLENPCPAGVMTEFVTALDRSFEYWMATFGVDPGEPHGGRLVIRDFRGKTDRYNALLAMRRLTGVHPFQHLSDSFSSFEKSGRVHFALLKIPLVNLDSEFGERLIRPEGAENEHRAIGDVAGAFSLDSAELKAHGNRITLEEHRHTAIEALRRWEDGSTSSWLEFAEKGTLNLEGEDTQQWDVMRGILFELCGKHGEAFLRRWLSHEVPRRPVSLTNEAADDNLVISASLAAGEDLSGRFEREWRWKVSDAAKAEIDRQLSRRPWHQTLRDAKPVEPTPVESSWEMRAWTGKHFRIEATGAEWTPQQMGKALAIKDAVHEYREWFLGRPLRSEKVDIQTIRENLNLRPGYFYPMRSSGVGKRSTSELHGTLRQLEEKGELRRWLGAAGSSAMREQYEVLISYPKAERVAGRMMADGLQLALDNIVLEKVHAPLRSDDSFGQRWLTVARWLRRYEDEFTGNWLALVGADRKEWKTTFVAAGVAHRLYRRFGDEFLYRLLAQEIPSLSQPQRDQDAIDGFFIACCRAARANLGEDFIGRWRWPVSDEIRLAIREAFPPRRIDGITGEEDWQNLLPALGTASSFRRSEWNVGAGDGRLVNARPALTGPAVIAIPTEPLTSYDLRCRMLRHEDAGFGWLLPTPADHVVLTWVRNSGRFGLEYFKEHNIFGSPMTSEVDGSAFKVGGAQDWIIEVRPDRLSVFIDGALFQEWRDLDWGDFRQAGGQSTRFRNLFGVTALGRKPGELEIQALEIRVHAMGTDEPDKEPPEAEPEIDLPDLPGLKSRLSNFQKARWSEIIELTGAFRRQLENERQAAEATGRERDAEDFRGAVRGLDRWAVRTRKRLATLDLEPQAPPPVIGVPHAALEWHGRFTEELAGADHALLASFGNSLTQWHAQLKTASRTSEAGLLAGYCEELRSSGTVPAAPVTVAVPEEPKSQPEPVVAPPTTTGFQGRLAAHASADVTIDLSPAAGIEDFVQIHVYEGGWVGRRAGGQTICSLGEGNRADIARIVAGPDRAYGLIDREGGLEVIGDPNIPQPPRQIRNVIDASFSTRHGLAINRDGDLLWWGNIYDNSWDRPPGNARRDVVAVAAGIYHALAVNRDGQMFFWRSEDVRLDQAFRSGIRDVAVGSRSYEDFSVALIRDEPGSPGNIELLTTRSRSTTEVAWLKGAGNKVYLYGIRDGAVALDMEESEDHPEVVALLAKLRDYPEDAVALWMKEWMNLDGSDGHRAQLVWIEQSDERGDPSNSNDRAE